MSTALPADGSRARRGHFGDWLRAQRGFRSVAEVAAAAARSPAWYERIEAGARRYLCLRDVRLLAQGLGIEVGEVSREAQKAGY